MHHHPEQPHNSHNHHHHQHQHTVEFFSASYDNLPNALPHSHNSGPLYWPSKEPSKVPPKYPIKKPPSSGVVLSKPTFSIYKPVVVTSKPTTFNQIYKVTTKKPTNIPAFRPPIIQDEIPIKPSCKCSKSTKIFKLSPLLLIVMVQI